MKIYMASRYSRRLELLDYLKQIEAAGHTVTSRWLNGSHGADTPANIAENGAASLARVCAGEVRKLWANGKPGAKIVIETLIE